MRIGQGFDAHRFCPGDHVLLGGVRIAHEYALEAHSDGDVLIHALIDALLGAAGLGDIGRLFPDSESRYRNIDSRVLLREVKDLLQDSGFSIGNIDTTVIAQAPRLSAHITPMRECLGSDLAVAPERINIKATTTEKMGFTGRGEGIAAMAVVLLEHDNAG